MILESKSSKKQEKAGGAEEMEDPMEERAPLKETDTWAMLRKYFNNNKNTMDMKDMFATDPKRFDKFSIMLDTPKDGPFLFDYSKNKVTLCHIRFAVPKCDFLPGY